VNNELHRIVKYVHAYIDRFFYQGWEKKNLLLISSSQKKTKCSHIRISEFVYTQTKGKRNKQQEEGKI